jgi:hypothetical protein
VQVCLLDQRDKTIKALLLNKARSAWMSGQHRLRDVLHVQRLGEKATSTSRPRPVGDAGAGADGDEERERRRRREWTLMGFRSEAGRMLGRNDVEWVLDSQDALPPFEARGKTVYRFSSHYWRWKLSLWQFLPFYDPRVQAAQQRLLAVDVANVARSSPLGGDGGDSAGGVFLTEVDHDDSGGNGGGSRTGRASPNGGGGGSGGGSDGHGDSSNVSGSHWCAIEDTDTELRLVSDDARWEDVCHAIPWEKDTLYALTIANLATKAAAGVNSPDLQYEAAHGILELASNRRVHRYILECTPGLPSAEDADAASALAGGGAGVLARVKTGGAAENKDGLGTSITDTEGTPVTASIPTQPLSPVFDSLGLFFRKGVSRAREPASAAMWSLAPVAVMRQHLLAHDLIKAAVVMVERDTDVMDRRLGTADGPRWGRISAACRARRQSMPEAERIEAEEVDEAAAREAVAKTAKEVEAADAAAAATAGGDNTPTLPAVAAGDYDGREDDREAVIGVVGAIACAAATKGISGMNATDDKRRQLEGASVVTGSFKLRVDEELESGLPPQRMVDHMLATQVKP